ncbi:MAG TPA: hypothetical protein ENN23_09400 [Deltaproteobacteria bacterium]|nr:hypothetical protein [Deltaproteobacteria bacterium]
MFIAAIIINLTGCAASDSRGHFLFRPPGY